MIDVKAQTNTSEFCGLEEVIKHIKGNCNEFWNAMQRARRHYNEETSEPLWPLYIEARAEEIANALDTIDEALKTCFRAINAAEYSLDQVRDRDEEYYFYSQE